MFRHLFQTNESITKDFILKIARKPIYITNFALLKHISFFLQNTNILRARAHWPLCLATGGRVFVAGLFIPVGNHYFQALASTLQFVALLCDRLWLVPVTDRAFLWLHSAFGSEHTSDCSCGMWQSLSRVGNLPHVALTSVG